MPLPVKSVVGSFSGTSADDGIIACPFRSMKARYFARISFPDICLKYYSNHSFEYRTRVVSTICGKTAETYRVETNEQRDHVMRQKCGYYTRNYKLWRDGNKKAVTDGNCFVIELFLKSAGPRRLRTVFRNDL